jgi:hypothetical protein
LRLRQRISNAAGEEDRAMNSIGAVAAEHPFRAKSAQARKRAARMAGEMRETLLDVAEHWETMARQAEALERSKQLIREWESAKTGAGEPGRGDQRAH